ncbi:hypothetical protein [Paraburkholderia gardini]|uniref:hypothetical protein n=1 Tax=Paraburkholderia gardini TaxID=2823469 RepID=UPI001D867191|nr:hypothetical protein [Paraburkholderia gardini]CAG4890855.1 hypothetical protein R69919_01053 [Paraburkholderia gardini]
MSKRKFSFNVTGRELFASEWPIAQALDAKYGKAEVVVTPKLSAQKIATVRRTVQSGKPRESAFFGIVEELRKAGTVTVTVLKSHNRKPLVIQAHSAKSGGALTTAAKAGVVKSAAAKTGGGVKAKVGKAGRAVSVATPGTAVHKAPAKKVATTNVAAVKRPTVAVKSTVRRTRSNPVISKTI